MPPILAWSSEGVTVFGDSTVTCGVNITAKCLNRLRKGGTTVPDHWDAKIYPFGTRTPAPIKSQPVADVAVTSVAADPVKGEYSQKYSPIGVAN